MNKPLTIQDKDRERVKRWKQAAKAVAKNSKSVNKEFQKFSRLKKHDYT